MALQPATFRANAGQQPEETRGKRVIVKLACGRIEGSEPVTSVSPKGWAADSARWSITGDPFDIAEWKRA